MLLSRLILSSALLKLILRCFLPQVLSASSFAVLIVPTNGYEKRHLYGVKCIDFAPKSLEHCHYEDKREPIPANTIEAIELMSDWGLL